MRITFRKKLPLGLPFLALAAALHVSCDSEPEAATGSGAASSSSSASSSTSGDAPDGPKDWPAAEPPVAIKIEDGVRRELVTIPSAAAPDNPTQGVATPANLNIARFIRYCEDVTPAKPARAIVVAMPGLFLGAGSVEPLAAAIVRRGAKSGETVEVWAIDRRANALEERRGIHAAEAQGDPEIARHYYAGQNTVGGVAFAGYETQASTAYASEWGLAVHAEDVRSIVGLVDAASRRGHVFLLGHSLGAWFAESYAAFRFKDGTSGFSELAGIIMVDGVRNDPAINEQQYTTDGVMTSGLPLPSLAGARSGSPLLLVPPLSATAFTDVLALSARFSPAAVVADPDRDAILAQTMELDIAALPAMTNAAALGFFYDDDFQPNFAIHVGLGEATGGPIESYTAQSPFGPVTAKRPSDPKATYEWVDAPNAPAPERVPVAVFANAWTRGATGGFEWYFPARLMLDLAAVFGNAVPQDGYQAKNGLSAFDGPANDAPFLAVAATVPLSIYDALKNRIAPAVGPGRPHAGEPRSSDLGFRVIGANMVHTETLMSGDAMNNPIPAAIEAFIAAHAEPGTITPGL